MILNITATYNTVTGEATVMMYPNSGEYSADKSDAEKRCIEEAHYTAAKVWREKLLAHYPAILHELPNKPLSLGLKGSDMLPLVANVLGLQPKPTPQPSVKHEPAPTPKPIDEALKQDAIAALMVLQYGKREATDAVAEALKTESTLESIIVKALSYIAS